MKRPLFFLNTAVLALALIACKNPDQQSGSGEGSKAPEEPKTAEVKPVSEKVMTAEDQAALTPDKVKEILKEGNQRFMKGDLTARDHSAQVRNSTYGQYPKAVIISCLDSRVPVEDVFDRGIGDIFVGRIAGNFVNVDLLGSLEFGCKVSGAKLILVMGHEHCGAIKAAIDDVKLGNITEMLTKIKPAVKMVPADFKGEKSSKNKEYVHNVCVSNVKNAMNEIRKNSSILKEMEEKGDIKIIGGVYNMSTGEVVFID